MLNIGKNNTLRDMIKRPQIRFKMCKDMRQIWRMNPGKSMYQNK